MKFEIRRAENGAVLSILVGSAILRNCTHSMHETFSFA